LACYGTNKKDGVLSKSQGSGPYRQSEGLRAEIGKNGQASARQQQELPAVCGAVTETKQSCDIAYIRISGPALAGTWFDCRFFEVFTVT
jgi:hypothetical protein